jgi:hypothetical protein
MPIIIKLFKLSQGLMVTINYAVMLS